MTVSFEEGVGGGGVCVNRPIIGSSNSSIEFKVIEKNNLITRK